MQNQTLRPRRMFLGVPQTDKIQVFKVSAGRKGVMTQAILSNTAEEDAKLTITLNTIDIMKDYVVAAGKTEIIDLYVVLDEDDSVSLQQDTHNAINVTLNGTYG